MFTLICDRPPFIRITASATPGESEAVFSCPIPYREEGQLSPVTPQPCKYVIARPFDDFASIAKMTGCDGEKLQNFNGGIVYPSRKIYLCP